MTAALALAALNPVPGPVHHLPLVTTALGVVFLGVLLLRAWRRRTVVALWWWTAGTAAFGAGTLLESIITLRGNAPWLTRGWFLAGAVLTAYLLAQGTAWTVLPRAAARLVTVVTVPLVLFVGAAVLLSPADLAVLEPHRPAGRVLQWQWIRLLTPLINGYALAMLVGGAVWSAWRARGRAGAGDRARAAGNALIATGALVAGIGGALAKTDEIEPLYVAELVGLVLIVSGYVASTRGRSRRACSKRRSPCSSP